MPYGVERCFGSNLNFVHVHCALYAMRSVFYDTVTFRRLDACKTVLLFSEDFCEI